MRKYPAVTALLLLSACADASSLLLASSPSPSPSVSASPRPCPSPVHVPRPTRPAGGGSIDDQMADVGRDVPEFAGLAIDEKAKVWIVMVTDGSQATAVRAKAAYDRITGSGDSFKDFRITAKKVTFSWVQLYDWYLSASRLVNGAMDVRMTDIDEAENKLAFGVADPSQNRACVDAGFKKLGIPAGAYSIVRQDPINLLGERGVGSSAPSVRR